MTPQSAAPRRDEMRCDGSLPRAIYSHQHQAGARPLRARHVGAARLASSRLLAGARLAASACLSVMEERRRPRGSASGGGRRPRPSSRAAGAALRRKVRELRRLVPGGEEAPAGALLVRTADYIVRLRARVELLRALAAVYGVRVGAVVVADGADAASADAAACAA